MPQVVKLGEQHLQRQSPPPHDRSECALNKTTGDTACSKQGRGAGSSVTDDLQSSSQCSSLLSAFSLPLSAISAPRRAGAGKRWGFASGSILLQGLERLRVRTLLEESIDHRSSSPCSGPSSHCGCREAARAAVERRTPSPSKHHPCSCRFSLVPLMLLFLPGVIIMATAAACASASAAGAAAAAANPKGEGGVLLAVGNPLLDVVANVDAEFLESFKLKPGDGVLQTEDQAGIYERVADFDPTYLPGGSALNTARTYHTMLGQPKSVTYLGAVGADEAGELLEELAEKEGLDMRLQKVAGTPTGMCAVLVHNKERTLCTNLGASSKLSLTDDLKDLADNADVCYTTTYVLQASKEVVYEFAKRCAETSKVLGLNLSSSFSVGANKHTLITLLPNVNILFGNNEEYIELLTGLGLVEPYDDTVSDRNEYEQRVCELALALMMSPGFGSAATTPGSASTSRSAVKAAVMTRRQWPIYIAEASPEGAVLFHQVSVPPVPEDEIIDLNGAGDAFVGGFLVGFQKGLTLSKSALLGSLAAGQIIRCEGFCIDASSLRGIMSDKEFS